MQLKISLEASEMDLQKILTDFLKGKYLRT